jgi:hypothetical protein
MRCQRIVDLHRLHGLGDAGIVEKDIHLSESRDGGLCGLLARLEVCHVTADADMIPPEFRRCVLGALLIEVENGDLRAMLGEETGGREPDSVRAGRTGNDDLAKGDLREGPARAGLQSHPGAEHPGHLTAPVRPESIGAGLCSCHHACDMPDPRFRDDGSFMSSTTSQFALAEDGEGIWSGESRDLTSAKAF